jgi:predicted SAM-dependent methyltransferase
LFNDGNKYNHLNSLLNRFIHLFYSAVIKIIIMLRVEAIKNILKRFRALVYRVTHPGNERECPLCGTHYSKFGKGGVERRNDAKCMNCGSLERHRFLWLYLQHKMKITQQKNLSVLHFAPEKHLEHKLREISNHYITADIEGDNVDIKVDITNTPFKKETFKLILCSHVLEHVTDDRKALNELLRILKTDGKALIIVPVEQEITFEDPSVTVPEERLRIFGQRDHVRIYGADFIIRLIESGFKVKTYLPKDLFIEDEQIKYGIKIESDRLYACSK